MRVLLFLVFLLQVGEGWAHEDLPALEKDGTYFEARIRLALLGWKPDEFKEQNKQCRGQKVKVCQTFNEAVACFGADRERCLFIWHKNETQIEIETKGRKPEIITVDLVRCRTGCPREAWMDRPDR